ncbi:MULTISPECIES: hypothetical protein [Streptomyces]|nr:hypothetical protein OG806_07460 [Streptomyces sp. NBC_00882]
MAELGLAERDFDEIVAQTQTYTNPSPVTGQALRSLLKEARKGSLAP